MLISTLINTDWKVINQMPFKIDESAVTIYIQIMSN